MFKIDYENKLIDFTILKDYEIINLYAKSQKKISYTDIYAYLKSKLENPDEPIWLSYIIKIKNYNTKKNKKSYFRKACNKFFIDENSKRLYQYRKLISTFDGKVYIIKSLIILEEEINNIILLFHKELGHIGINRLLYEIERRGLFCSKISKKIEEIIKKCSICIVNKLNIY